ncbi:M56/M15 family metallopeptidase [Flaviaesturariibacter aridisoli]|uniref:N-acetylmuramoyl-L-alanine amidase n=1 Tax=Flaviaesturariibacter aridisoli TaxID=2545761 RepID=A0A4R4DWD1_9BACT|nr:M56/M15 family metallopeptidase [Flaviaesturariibacter aridisoli]TCZ68400.1 hypothetical protein E0486_14045 [Flaviaesturariibacter aridisoli]
MSSLFPYLLKTVLCAALLYGYYWLALRNRVFHQWNRFYLLLIVPLSLLLPLARIEVTRPAATAAELPVRLLQVVSDGNAYVETVVPQTRGFDPMTAVYCIYTVVALVLLFRFGRSLLALLRLARRYPAQRVGEVDFILVPVPGTPFSFFRRVFWNPALDPSTEGGQQILQHELVHVRERHSFDKLLLQAALVLCWFNPIFWLLRNELHLVHEFIADERSVRDRDAGTLAALILQAAYPEQYAGLTNPFFHRAIKRRLYMLNQLQKTRVRYFGRVAALPLLGLIAFTFAVRAQKSEPVVVTQTNSEKFTVVIDAGHGRMADGGWNGARSNGVTEDQLVLDLAQRIKALNADPNLNIVFTRADENIVDLKERPEIARRAGARLFLSLHVDQYVVSNGPLTGAPEGFSVYVSADTGVRAGSRLFGSALQQSLTKVYPTDGQLRNLGAWVLKNSPCPAALIELGYIDKDADRAFLTKDSNRDRIAQAILNSIAAYRQQVPNASADVLPAKATSDVSPAAPAADLRPVQAPADVRASGPAAAPADVIESVDVNPDRSVTLVYGSGRKDSMSASDAVALGYLNNIDGIVTPVRSSQNPRSAVPLKPVVIGLKSGDTLSVEIARALPVQAIISPDGLSIESCTLTANMSNGEIWEAPMKDRQTTTQMKRLLQQAWSGMMITVDNRTYRAQDGSVKKAPSLVYFVK